ncbi:MAG: SxtJ family membrane protein [Armatimonadota bacterium]|nr:SxtJ family membrane protein [Armatimonadota bacterium]
MHTGHVNREARSFGRGVGGVLLLVGVYLAWRGRAAAPAMVPVVAGALLVVLAQLAPRLLALPAALWMRLAHVLGWLSTRLVLGLVFFVVLTPIALVKRIGGYDPLDRRGPPRDSYWTPYPTRQRDPRTYERMF